MKNNAFRISLIFIAFSMPAFSSKVGLAMDKQDFPFGYFDGAYSLDSSSPEKRKNVGHFSSALSVLADTIAVQQNPGILNLKAELPSLIKNWNKLMNQKSVDKKIYLTPINIAYALTSIMHTFMLWNIKDKQHNRPAIDAYTKYLSENPQENKKWRLWKSAIQASILTRLFINGLFTQKDWQDSRGKNAIIAESCINAAEIAARCMLNRRFIKAAKNWEENKEFSTQQ